MSQVVTTHYYPFAVAFAYKVWATIIIIIEFERCPVVSYCFTAAESVNKNSCNHDALISAKSFKSIGPILGFKNAPMKKS